MKNLLITINSYLPGFKSGGPVQSVSFLSNILADEYNITILTNDRDSKSLTQYKNIVVNRIHRMNNYAVIYLKKGSFFKAYHIYKQIAKSRPNIIYLNSFFNPWFTLYVLVISKFIFLSKINIVVAPRGEFSPGAIEEKGRKKHTTIKLMKISRLLKSVSFHFTNDIEKRYFFDFFSKQDIRSFFISNNLKKVNVPNLYKLESLFNKKKEQELRICFISRIVKKKNLIYVLKMIEKFTNQNEKITLNIYGPIEDTQYWQSCLSIINTFSNNIEVNQFGFVDHSDISNVFLTNDLFFFPTKGENFGHVIIESLAHGCPVLLSDQTPWLDLELVKAGWVFQLQEINEPFNTLRNILAMDHRTFLEYRKSAYNYAQKYFNEEVNINIDRFKKGLETVSR